MASRAPSADRPITAFEEDALGRAPFVRLLATQTLSAPAEAGFVMGLTGPWGTGKTSTFHLVEREIGDRAAVLWFNPWLFEGGKQLIAAFFSEVVGQLKKRPGAKLTSLAKALAAYGEAVAPIAGLVVDPAGGAAVPEALKKLSQTSAREQYEKVERALADSKTKLVVFIDDFDRLTAPDVLEVVRLVKLIADLPNIVYVLAYDQARVERALGDEAESGRGYLEKIVQAPHALPPISRARLRQIALDDLQEAIGDRDLGHFDEDQWSLIAPSILEYVTTIRAAKRYANVAVTALDLVGQEVAAHDVLALTALRVFDAEVHAALAGLQDELTGEADNMEGRDPAQVRAQRERRLQEVLDRSANREVTQELLRVLFPAAPLGPSSYAGRDRKWRATQRVASRAVLSFYLHAALDPDQVGTAQLDQILTGMGEPATLRELLEAVKDEQLPELLDRLRDHQDRFPIMVPEEAAAEFLRIEPRVPTRPGLFQLRGGLTTEWVIQDLMSRVLAGGPRMAAIERLFDLAEGLSERWRVLSAFGAWPESDPRPGDEPALSQEATAALESRLAEQIRATDPAELAAEPHLTRLLAVLLRHDGAAARKFLDEALADDAFFLAVAKACIRRIPIGTPPFRQAEMDLNALGAFVGGIDPAARAEQIQQSGDGLATVEREALELLGTSQG